MRLSAVAEAAAPAHAVLAHLADFEAHEARARARGLSVERLPEAGPVWHVGYDLLGARRETRLRVASQDASGLRIATETSGVEGDVAVRLTPLGPERTRIAVEVALAARTLGARLALAPVRVAGGALERRLADGLAETARRVGADWARARAGG